VTDEEIQQIDASLRAWRQGDIVFGAELPAVHLAHLAVPVTAAATELAAEAVQAGDALDLAVVSRDFEGFMIVSQTCDIVRSVASREFVELCPLVTVGHAQLGQVRSGRMPRYLSCSGLGEQPLAADLDQVTTIEKSLLVRFNEHRVSGIVDDDEGRRLASALARKRARAALPNEFVAYLGPLQKRVKEKHGKQTPEGEFLATMREIRTAAHPNWSAAQVEVDMMFLFNGLDEIPADADAQVEALINRLPASETYLVSGRALSLEQLTAAQYITSDALDLDALSDG
jgi:hypothetical protein